MVLHVEVLKNDVLTVNLKAACTVVAPRLKHGARNGYCADLWHIDVLSTLYEVGPVCDLLRRQIA
jgi:hypothetical protein